jgi:hypothetical protein
VIKKIFGVVLAVVGGVLTLVLVPFLAHAVMNAIYVLLLGRPVPGWWWRLIGPIQNVVALPAVAFAFVIKVGSTMSLIAPLIVFGVLTAVGVLLLWLGVRMVRKGRSVKP